VVVHDVEVDDVGASGQDIVDFLTQTGEIGGQNRRSNGEGLHDAPFLSEITVARIVLQEFETWVGWRMNAASAGPLSNAL
jgi:hypothetical protein